jgi:cytochrome d ubiquinol oxidase subunit II
MAGTFVAPDVGRFVTTVPPVALAALVGLAALALYAVFGGADFGGGVWDLLAWGPRAKAQRDAINHAIGPVWESNHVWLIFAVVILFTCFPPAFADIATGLNAPLCFALVGIVMRGSAFVFRNYATESPALVRVWTATFGIASLITPFWFGDAIGALATGRYAWLSAFALSTGVFAVAVCAQIAAIFLVREVDDDTLREDFRRRGISATLAVWIAGFVPAAIALAAEPVLFGEFLAPRALAAMAAAIVLGLIVMLALARRKSLIARVAVGGEALAILIGWFGAQAPALVPGRYTYLQAASSDAMIVAFLIAALIGAVLLVPSLLLLFTVFKGPRSMRGAGQTH